MNSQYNADIEKLYLQMYDRLFIYARCTLKNDALAEEAVQETFRIACQKPEDLLGSPKPEGWLINTLKNVMANMIRNRAVANRIFSEYVAAQAKDYAVSEDRMSFEVLYENIADTDEFQLLKEMTVEGKSHLEMAQKRGISVDAIKKRVQRAKEILRNKIKI